MNWNLISQFILYFNQILQLRLNNAQVLDETEGCPKMKTFFGVAINAQII